ncbi:hypothetical protein TNCV_668821 [Trichonephila clavipes]|nr:hypothetical protein TNCV_668821 [Trichonephila clavipes]
MAEGVDAINQERCRRGVWSRIVIQQQSVISVKSSPLFPNYLFRFIQGVAVSPGIDGSSHQKVQKQIFLGISENYEEQFTYRGSCFELLLGR